MSNRTRLQVLEQDKGQDGNPRARVTTINPVQSSSQRAKDQEGFGVRRLEPKLRLIPGDLFAAPENSVLIHACNCVGRWGSGVAKAFKDHYPAAYQIYHTHCLGTTPPPPSNPSHKPSGPSPLLGTALLIPPQPSDYLGLRHAASDTTPFNTIANTVSRAGRNYIACLFTSTSYGSHVDPPSSILKNTKLALEDLQRQVSLLEQNNEEHFSSGGKAQLQQSNIIQNKSLELPRPQKTWHSAKINSKRFNVDWQLTEGCFLEALKGTGREVIVYEFDEGLA